MMGPITNICLFILAVYGAYATIQNKKLNDEVEELENTMEWLENERLKEKEAHRSQLEQIKRARAQEISQSRRAGQAVKRFSESFKAS